MAKTQLICISIRLILAGTLLLSSQGICEWGRTARDNIRLPLTPNPEICSDGNGGAWVAGNPIGLCHVDRLGNLTWGDEPFLIPPANSFDPHLITASNGDVIIAMDYSSGYDDPPNVTVHRFNQNQEYVWGEEGIELDSTNRLQSVIGLFNGPIEGTYLIHWMIVDENYIPIDWCLQLVNEDGESLWDIFTMSGDYRYAFTKISITSDQSIIAAHNLPLDGEQDMEIQKIDPNGRELWNEQFMITNNEYRWNFIDDIESDRNGGILLAYEHERRETINDSLHKYRGVSVMRISDSGDSLWTRNLYERNYISNPRYTINPRINYAGFGRFFVAWGDNPHSFQVAAINNQGEILWQQPIALPDSVCFSPLESVDSDSSVCYVWHDAQPNRDIRQQQFGQRINLQGERLWGDRGRPVQARGYYEHSAITTDSNGGIITVLDFGSRTIQMMNKYGEIGVVLEVGIDDRVPPDNRIKNNPELNIYPNPTNGSTTLHFSNPLLKNTTLKIYDLQGRLVYSSQVNAGAWSQVVDVAVFPAGSYVIEAGNIPQILRVLK